MDDEIIQRVKETATLTTVNTVSLLNVNVGDTIVRHFYGVEMNLVVEKIEDGIVYAKTDWMFYEGAEVAGWMFYQDTGLEYDPDLGMTKENNMTCSWIVKVIPLSEG